MSVSSCNKIRIAVSSCLLGEKVRYDGEDKLDQELKEFFEARAELVSICPEFSASLGVPRAPISFFDDELKENETQFSVHKKVKKASIEIVEKLKREKIDGLILKSKSPSCGISSIPNFKENVAINERSGLFASIIMSELPELPISDEQSLALEENKTLFIKQIEKYHRNKNMKKFNPIVFIIGFFCGMMMSMALGVLFVSLKCSL